MPVDREETLRRAEKLLRQGRLDRAIAEYVRLVADQPDDWGSMNALGHLYVRAGQFQFAVARFTNAADHLFQQGFLPNAALLYKKVLKITGDAYAAGVENTRHGRIGDAIEAFHAAARSTLCVFGHQPSLSVCTPARASWASPSIGWSAPRRRPLRARKRGVR